MSDASQPWQAYLADYVPAERCTVADIVQMEFRLAGPHATVADMMAEIVTSVRATLDADGFSDLQPGDDPRAVVFDLLAQLYRARQGKDLAQIFAERNALPPGFGGIPVWPSVN